MLISQALIILHLIGLPNRSHGRMLCWRFFKISSRACCCCCYCFVDGYIYIYIYIYIYTYRCAQSTDTLDRDYRERNPFRVSAIYFTYAIREVNVVDQLLGDFIVATARKLLSLFFSLSVKIY